MGMNGGISASGDKMGSLSESPPFNTPHVSNKNLGENINSVNQVNNQKVDVEFIVARNRVVVPENMFGMMPNI